MDPNFDLDASLHRSTNDDDEGFDNSLILILEKDDNVDYLDDPIEVVWNDYHDFSDMSQADKFEKWLNDQEKAEYPDPSKISLNDGKIFDEFDSNFASSSVEF